MQVSAVEVAVLSLRGMREPPRVHGEARLHAFMPYAASESSAVKHVPSVARAHQRGHLQPNASG